MTGEIRPASLPSLTVDASFLGSLSGSIDLGRGSEAHHEALGDSDSPDYSILAWVNHSDCYRYHNLRRQQHVNCPRAHGARAEMEIETISASLLSAASAESGDSFHRHPSQESSCHLVPIYGVSERYNILIAL